MKKNLHLKMALFEQGVTQDQLAKETVIPRSYISQAIHGRYVMDDEQKIKISEMLGLSTKELFEEG